jgi:hypothetical protein
MRFRNGDQFRCPSPECRLGVKVIEKGKEEEIEGLLWCSCGFHMKRSYGRREESGLGLARRLNKAGATRNSQL